VDRREAIVEDIDQTDHAYDAVFGELHQSGVDAALQQELGVLFVAVFVHAPAGVAGLLVAIVERVMLVKINQRQFWARRLAWCLAARRWLRLGCRSATGRRTGTQA
jgi:hypothetical protein